MNKNIIKNSESIDLIKYFMAKGELGELLDFCL